MNYWMPRGGITSVLIRRTGLPEKLWNGFERLKTITVGKDKKLQIAQLIEWA